MLKDYPDYFLSVYIKDAIESSNTVSPRNFGLQLLFGFPRHTKGLQILLANAVKLIAGAIAACLVIMWMLIPWIVRSFVDRSPQLSWMAWAWDVVWYFGTTYALFYVFVWTPVQFFQFADTVWARHYWLNLMLSDGAGAARHGLPRVRITKSSDLCTWVEARSAVLAGMVQEHARLEYAVGATFIANIACIVCALYTARHEENWRPGVLFLSTSAGCFLVPGLLIGLRVNLELGEQRDLLARVVSECRAYDVHYAVHCRSRATELPQGYMKLMEEARKCAADARDMARDVHIALKDDTKNSFCVLGFEIQAARLGTLASVVYSVAGYAASLILPSGRAWADEWLAHNSSNVSTLQ